MTTKDNPKGPWHPCEDYIIPVAKAFERLAQTYPPQLSPRSSYELESALRRSNFETGRRWIEFHLSPSHAEAPAKRVLETLRKLKDWERRAITLEDVSDWDDPDIEADARTGLSERLRDDYDDIIDLALGTADYLRQFSEMLRGKIERGDAQRAKETSPAEAENTFRRTGGKYWQIVFRGESLPILPDRKGLWYLALLLGRGEESWTAVDLWEEVEKLTGQRPRVSSTDQSGRENDPGEAPRHRRQVGRAERIEMDTRLKELPAEMKKAKDEGRDGDVAALRAELYELSDKRQEAEPSAKNHYKKARSCIMRAIAAIEDVDPNLGTHLRKCVRTGYTLTYTGDLEWSPF